MDMGKKAVPAVCTAYENRFSVQNKRKDGNMKLFSYLSVAVLLLSSLALAAYSPDLLSALIVGLMCIIALAGCIHGLLPTISITAVC